MKRAEEKEEEEAKQDKNGLQRSRCKCITDTQAAEEQRQKRDSIMCAYPLLSSFLALFKLYERDETKLYGHLFTRSTFFVSRPSYYSLRNTHFNFTSSWCTFFSSLLISPSFFTDSVTHPCVCVKFLSSIFNSLLLCLFCGPLFLLSCFSCVFHSLSLDWLTGVKHIHPFYPSQRFEWEAKKVSETDAHGHEQRLEKKAVHRRCRWTRVEAGRHRWNTHREVDMCQITCERVIIFAPSGSTNTHEHHSPTESSEVHLHQVQAYSLPALCLCVSVTRTLTVIKTAQGGARSEKTQMK